MIKSGLRESEIQFDDIPAGEVLNALENGKIDAGHTWEPITSEALNKGYKILAKAGDYPGLITDILVFNSKIIDERPKDIQAIVKSMLEARDFVFTDRKEAVEIMAKAQNMNPEDIGNGINGVYMLDLSENIESMKDSEKETSLYTIGRTITEFYLTRGQLQQIPAFNEIIEPGFLTELSKEKYK